MTSYLSRPSIELSPVESVQRGSRWFARRSQYKQHRVVEVDIDTGILLVDSTLRFRIDEAISVSVNGQTIRAVVESFEHNPLTEEQRYVLLVQRTARQTLSSLEETLLAAEAARVERRGPNRAFAGSAVPAGEYGDLNTDTTSSRQVA